jgi:hypothetical protein
MLENAEIYRMFKLINDDFNQHGSQMRIGQSVMNNLRTLDYSLYLKLTGSEIDPFYIDKNIIPALTSVSELSIIIDMISRYYRDDNTNSILKLKLEKLL